MAARSARRRPVFHWIPPSTAKHKIVVERNDGTTDDITSIAHYAEFRDGITDVMGNQNLFSVPFFHQILDLGHSLGVVRNVGRR